MVPRGWEGWDKVGLGHRGHPSLPTHCTLGGEGPRSICSTLSPSNAGIPLEPPQVTGHLLHPGAVRQQNISKSCLHLPLPLSITAPSLHNCCLPPGCTMSKHVVLTLGGGGRVSRLEDWDMGTRGAGLAEALLPGPSGCCVTDTVHSCLTPSLLTLPKPPAGEGKMGGKTGCLHSRVKERHPPTPGRKL